MKLQRLVLVMLATLWSTRPIAAAERLPRVVPRVILAIYDSRYQNDIRDTKIHRLLEMPLNHLGLVVRYQDLNAGLPTLEQLQDVRGIVTWFQSDAMQNPVGFLAWAEAAIDAGKRFVVLGDLSVTRNLQGQATQTALINRFLAKLGLRADDWVPVTYNLRIVYKDPRMMDFERSLPAILPSFDAVKVIDRSVRVHLMAGKANDARTGSALIVTGPHGGYAASGYTHFATYAPPDANSRTAEVHLQWYLNPFEFFRLAFAADEVPKPDTTTVSGRRIYYSHIDGDGWRNLTEVARYRGERISSAEVILRETIRPFPDLPVTVGPIAGDLDPHWFGNQESLRVAREILSISWVEAGSHTYSHPLDWETLSLEAKDATASQKGLRSWWEQTWWPLWERVAEPWSDKDTSEDKPSDHQPKFRRGQSRLRSYDLYPFDVNQEIGGSIDFINHLLPAGKRVQLLQWSGTTLESQSVMEATRRAGVRNINGGDTRFDPEFDSYAWVAPLGRQVGRYRQIYSSESNENTYTNLWNERYFGFRYLIQTLRNTESPIRVKPFNLYYHMFSGEKDPGLQAVLGNLAYARSQELAPITASQYAAIADGFFSATFTEIANHRWRVENRDGLNTVRFDHAEKQAVDWANSRDVIGQRHYQGSLYVALDPAGEAPIVALRDTNVSVPKSGDRAYLIQSRWLISHLQIDAGGFSFTAHGFGPGEMEWHARPAARYTIEVSCRNVPPRQIEVAAGLDGTLRFTLPDGQPAGAPIPEEVTVKETVNKL